MCVCVGGGPGYGGLAGGRGYNNKLCKKKKTALEFRRGEK